ncbi:hypothetical protein VTO73DRAFT_8809 [Trametes versicolor]
MATHLSILDLNQDVLNDILEELHAQKCLIQLAMTCQIIRGAANHTLFRRCRVAFSGPIAARRFPPDSLWRYIRHLLLVEERPDADVLRGNYPRIEHPTLCGYVVSDLFYCALRRMPLLSKISISTSVRIYHGLPWPCVQAILAVPQLQELRISQYLLCTLGATRAQELDMDVAPLTSFTYWLDISRGDPRSHPAEREALGILLPKLSRTLQKLELPIESLPQEIVRYTRWPHLRHLSVYGEASPQPKDPYIVILGNMPQLRSLALTFTIKHEMSTPVIWPSGLTMECPWPDLENLTIMHPHLEDQIYRRLPSTLNRLLLCSPLYHYDFIWGRGGVISERWLQGPLLTASQTLRLLSRCQTPDLTELAIEFHEDNEEFELLDFLPHAFPRLTSLTANIYRSPKDHAKIPVAKIARALTPLCRLETLRMYPGFRPASAPQPFIPIPHFGPFRENREVVRLDRVRDRAAQTIANTLGPSLRTIFLLHPSQPPSFYWMEYHVVPAPYGRAVEDHRGLGRGYHLKYARGVLLAAPQLGGL